MYTWLWLGGKRWLVKCTLISDNYNYYFNHCVGPKPSHTSQQHNPLQNVFITCRSCRAYHIQQDPLPMQLLPLYTLYRYPYDINIQCCYMHLVTFCINSKIFHQLMVSCMWQTVFGSIFPFNFLIISFVLKTIYEVASHTVDYRMVSLKCTEYIHEY